MIFFDIDIIISQAETAELNKIFSRSWSFKKES